MCLLLLLRRVVEGYPIVLLMNRDEVYGRLAEAPILTKDGPDILAPSDRQAGGTWIGVNDMGLVVAISNRHEGHFDSTRRSRGLLCLDALGLSSALEVKDFVEEEVAEVGYNPFNLIYCDRGRAFVTHCGDQFRTMELREDVHLLANMDMDDIEHPRVRRARELLEASDISGLDEFLEALHELASDHEIHDGQSICLHRERAGTVSSTIIALSEEFPRRSLFLYSPQSPCQSAYDDYSPLLEEMVG